MISAILFGGLGNQLFQFAAAYAEALRAGDQLVIPEPFRGETHDAESKCAMSQIIDDSGCSGELDIGCLIMPQGYYQDAKYFEGYEGCLLDSLAPIHPKNRNTDHIAIHVRMGDYLDKQGMHPVVSSQYIRTAVESQLEQGASRFVHLFSDSPGLALPYVKEALLGLDIHLSSIPETSSVEHLRLLAEYDYLICSNSTFSWWAAWLHRAISSEATVVMPTHWFGRQFEGDWQHIYRGATTGKLRVI